MMLLFSNRAEEQLMLLRNKRMTEVLKKTRKSYKFYDDRSRPGRAMTFCSAHTSAETFKKIDFEVGVVCF